MSIKAVQAYLLVWGTVKFNRILETMLAVAA
jgi:hypothetical protein